MWDTGDFLARHPHESPWQADTREAETPGPQGTEKSQREALEGRSPCTRNAPRRAGEEGRLRQSADGRKTTARFP